MSILIDTSFWIEALRKGGSSAIQRQVKHLLLSGEAAICDMILLELCNGARDRYQKDKIRQLESTLILLPIDTQTWERSKEVAVICRGKGLSMPVTDLIIVSVALRYDVPIVHADRHFDLILNAVA